MHKYTQLGTQQDIFSDSLIRVLWPINEPWFFVRLSSADLKIKDKMIKKFTLCIFYLITNYSRVKIAHCEPRSLCEFPRE